jgi:hypothetical protein
MRSWIVCVLRTTKINCRPQVFDSENNMFFLRTEDGFCGSKFCGPQMTFADHKNWVEKISYFLWRGVFTLFRIRFILSLLYTHSNILRVCEWHICLGHRERPSWEIVWFLHDRSENEQSLYENWRNHDI